MAQNYSPKIVTDGLVMCLDPSQNKSYPTTDLPIKDGLVMWMDAADDTTFSYSSGTTVSQWRDKSGYNYHMVPKVSGPTRNAFLNSRKVLAFTTSQTIGNNTINLASSANTVFVVSRLTGTTNGRVLTCNLDASGNNWLLGHHGGTYNDYFAEGWVADGGSLDTNWRMYMGDWSGASTDLANFYSNGTSIITNSTAASQGPNKLGVNYYSNELSTCEVAEIIVYNKVLSSAERRLVHTYLGQKWGILNVDRSIIDLSGNNTHGLFGNATVANMPLYDYYNKGSLKFDGSNDEVNFGDVIKFTNTQDFTLETWVNYIPNSTSYVPLISKEAASPAFGYALKVDETYNYNPYIVITGVGAYRYAAVNINDGRWHHVVGVAKAGSATIDMYVDGVLNNGVSNLPAWTGTANSIQLRLGLNYGGALFKGELAGCKIYNRALNSSEVTQNYEAQKSKFVNTLVQQGLVFNIDAGNPYSYAGSGTVVYDVSVNTTNSGSLIGGTSYSTSNGGVFVFDGVDDYILTNYSQNTDNAQITWEAWFWDNSPGGFFDNTAIISNYGPVGTTPFTILHIISDGRPYFGQRNNSGTESSAVYSVNICDGVWHHIVGVVDNSNMLIYVDGVLRASQAKVTGTTTSGQNIVIGGNHLGRYQSCRMGSARIYNVALSAAQVLQNYNATKDRFGL